MQFELRSKQSIWVGELELFQRTIAPCPEIQAQFLNALWILHLAVHNVTTGLGT